MSKRFYFPAHVIEHFKIRPREFCIDILKSRVIIWSTFVNLAAIAQLGERQTEDLKVPGSIPGGGNFFFVCILT